jgi:hypothetical protein
MINLLYSHVTQSVLPNGSSSAGVLLTKVVGRDVDKALNLELHRPSLKAVLVEYGPTNTPIDLHTPLSCRSSKSIRDRVHQQSYEVIAGSPSALQSRRVKYFPNQGLSQYSFTSEVSSETAVDELLIISDLPNRDGFCSLIDTPTFTTSPAPLIPVTIGDTQLMTVLPNALGSPDFITNEFSTFIDIGSPLKINHLYSFGSSLTYDWSATPAATTSKAFIPAESGGYLASSFVSLDMHTKNLLDVSLGILSACANNDDELVVSSLKAVLTLSKRWGFIQMDSLNSFVPSPDLKGFPEGFTVQDQVPSSAPTFVLSNAILGLSICRSLTYLQDRFPVLSVELYGNDLSFNSALRSVLLYLSRYCASSVSLGTGYCSETFIEAEPDSIDSISTSYAVALFLGEALSIHYDSFTHYRFGRLQYVLRQQPAELLSNLLTDFGDLTNDSYLDPQGLLSETSLSLKGICLVYGFKILWSLQHESKNSILELLQDYEAARLSYVESLPAVSLGSTLTLSDYLVAYCHKVLNFTLSVSTAVPLWAELAYQNATPSSLKSWAFYSLTQEPFLIFSLRPFDPLEYSAKAMATQNLQELRRMWPFGYQWMSQEAEESSDFVLGSILKAQADVSLDWCLSYLLYKQAKDLRKAQGRALRALANTLLPETLLCSDDFIRQYVLNYQAPRPSSLSELLDQTSLTQGVSPLTFEVLYPEGFYQYKDDPFETSGSWHAYEEAPLWNPQNLLSQQYLTIGYRPLLPKTSDFTQISSSLSVSSTLGLEPRPVPGFPFLHPIISLNDLNVSESIPLNISPTDNPLQNGYFLDNPVVIKPLSRFHPCLIFKSLDAVGNYFVPYLNDKLSTGNTYFILQGFPHNSDFKALIQKA